MNAQSKITGDLRKVRRTAPAVRTHTGVAIRPDIHERFRAIVAKVDAAITTSLATLQPTKEEQDDESDDAMRPRRERDD